MWIKDLEIISDDLSRKISKNLPQNEHFLAFLEKIPQKPKGLFIKPYKEFYIVANFAAGGWIVVLNQKAKKLFDLIDNKHSIKELYELFLKAGSDKFSKQDIRFFWEKKISAGDVFNKVVFDHPLINIEDFSKFSGLLKKTKLIYFLDEKKREEKNYLTVKKIDVWMHLTNQCNFRCKYCYVDKASQVMEDKTAFLIIDKVFEAVKKYGIKRIDLRFGGGEPLLEFPKIKKILGYVNERYGELIKRSGINVISRILSNGSLINEEIIQFIKENRVKIAVSLDGPSEIHNKQRLTVKGEGTFDLVKRSLDLLRNAKISFNVLTVVASYNLESLPDLVKWFVENKIYFGFIFVRKNPFTEYDLMPTNEKMIKTFSKIYDYLFLNTPNYNITPAVTNLMPHRYDIFSDNGCGVGRNFVPFDQNGDIYPCHTSFSQKELKIGSVCDFDTDIISLINRAEVRKFNPGLKGRPECQKCEWKYICSNPCPLSNFFEDRDVREPSRYCPIYKALIPRALELEAERLLKYRRM